VISAGFDDVISVVSRGEALMQAVNSGDDFKTTVESFNRVSNLAAKAEKAEVQEPLFVEEAESNLFRAWQSITADYHAALSEREGAKALALLADIKEAVTKFFDSVMVMAEDERVRANRLGLLASIDRDLKQFADFNKLVW
ncbi:DALR anticodon-binding domain-containing protein, partial [Paenibacillus favisporus]|uniref:DALR anticodon-binding domain-containing protein n=1 Tax=Paenibacillus favisporus TaxID=221028 RepID=UPI002DB7BB61